jgi:hypothetical protein
VNMPFRTAAKLVIKPRCGRRRCCRRAKQKVGDDANDEQLENGRAQSEHRKLNLVTTHTLGSRRHEQAIFTHTRLEYAIRMPAVI